MYTLNKVCIVRTQIILTAKEAYTYFKKLIQNSSYSECDPNLRTMKTFRSLLNFKSKTVLTAVVVLLLCLDLSMAKFTPLEIDNHPCTAEKLKVTFKKYISHIFSLHPFCNILRIYNNYLSLQIRGLCIMK